MNPINPITIIFNYQLFILLKAPKFYRVNMESLSKEQSKLKEENFRLKAAAKELSINNDVTSTIRSTQSLEKTLMEVRRYENN